MTDPADRTGADAAEIGPADRARPSRAQRGSGAERLVLAHGFTQTARSWAVLDRLVRDELPNVETIAVDLPGHGDAAQIDADLWGSADRLVSIGGPATYVGYSMGGRVALHAALAHAATVRRLILIGATPGIEDDDERATRRASDDALASHIEDVGVGTFLDEWLANPLFAGLDATTAGRDDRLRNTAAGLASSLRRTGTGTQQPLWERLDAVRAPVLLLVGAHDAKFTAIAERMAAALPDATLRVIAGAGHSVHLERPAATATAIVEWLDATADVSR